MVASPMSLEGRAGTTDRAQALMLSTKALYYPAAPPENKAVGRSFSRAAVGRKMQ